MKFQIDLKKVLWLKVKNTVMDMLLVILTVKKLLEHFLRNNCKKKSKEFRVHKVINRKVDKLYAKWKGYDIWFNSWIGKKDSIKE